jgi:hypothetical protein
MAADARWGSCGLQGGGRGGCGQGSSGVRGGTGGDCGEGGKMPVDCRAKTNNIPFQGGDVHLKDLADVAGIAVVGVGEVFDG